MRNEYYNALRRYIEMNKSKTQYGGRLSIYEIRDDEIYDASLVSLRAYGSRAYADVVRTAAGVSFSYEPLPVKPIYLPDLSVVLSLQKRHGVKNA